MQLSLAITYIYPNAIPMQDFVVRDDSDGRGQYIDEWHLTDPKPTQEQLDTAWIGHCKQDRISQLGYDCQNTIYSGFTGTNGHQYQFEDKDQANLTQQMLFLVNDPTIMSVSWKTLDVGVISHTRDEFLQVCKDANNFKSSNFGKYWTLEAQVNSATTEDEINAIVW